MTYQFKIKLKGSAKPPIWRRICMDSQMTFWQFHLAIQGAFGWQNAHLFHFAEHPYQSPQISFTYEDPFGDEADNLQADQIRLAEIFQQEKQAYAYVYDFGDNWEHEILLEKIDANQTLTLPQCLTGKGMTPPEDVGGIHGYYYFVEVVSDPTHPEFMAMREWAGMESDTYWDVKWYDHEHANEGIAFYFTHFPDMPQIT